MRPVAGRSPPGAERSMRAAEVRVAGERRRRCVCAPTVMTPLQLAGAKSCDVRRLVAGRDDDHRALRERVVDRFLDRLVAGAEAAEAHVDDLGGRRCWRHAGDLHAGRPQHALEHVVERAAALRRARAPAGSLTPVVDAGDADAVVGVGGDQPGDEQAVEEAVVLGTAAFAVAPVAFVARIRDRGRCRRARGRVGDEVVAGQHASGEVGVRQDAGVDHRDGHAGGARLQRPTRSRR